MLLTILLMACKKENADKSSTDLSGAYSGIFFRTGMDTAEVQLKFSEAGFEGESDHAKYPAICGGTYRTTSGHIDFTDTCTWTADFDWTLILDGSFSIEHTGNILRLTRTNGTVTDEYNLTRMSR